MILVPHIIYVNGKPQAISPAKDAEHALESYRLAMLGHVKDEKEVVTAMNAWDAPIEDVLRVGMLGLYARMFQGDMAAMAAAAKRS